MKKRGLWLLAIGLLLLCFALSACQAKSGGDPTEEENGQQPNIEDLTAPTHFHAYGKDDLCEICGEEYRDIGLKYQAGVGGYYVSDYEGEYSKVYIPERYNGWPVLRIEESAFEGRLDITEVAMPNTIRYIGTSAFRGCAGLSKLTLSQGLEEIGEGAFAGCSALNTLVLPDSVSTIGNGAFGRCTGLKTIALGSGVTSLGEYAFRNCNRLASIVLPAGITTIAEFTFENCNNLKTVEFLGGVKTIEKSAFAYCDELAELELPEGLETIGEEAFNECTGLEKLTIPTTLQRSALHSFIGCTGLKGIYIKDMAAWCSIVFDSNVSNPLVYADVLYLDNEPVVDLVIPEGVKTIGSFAFYNYDHLQTVKFSNTVTTLRQYSFTNCNNLREMTFEKSLKYIGLQAINECTSLTLINYMGNREQWETVDKTENRVSARLEIKFLG